MSYIIHPTTETKRMETWQGTHVLKDDSDLLGQEINDRRSPPKLWMIIGAYGPPQGRRLQGIRVKVRRNQDQVVSFCEQIYLEVLMGKTGYCSWAMCQYPILGSSTFYAFVMDDTDLLDDLADRELCLPSTFIKEGTKIQRRIHLDEGSDFEDELIHIRNVDLRDMTPSDRYNSLEARWQRTTRTRIR